MRKSVADVVRDKWNMAAVIWLSVVMLRPLRTPPPIPAKRGWHPAISRVNRSLQWGRHPARENTGGGTLGGETIQPIRH